MVANRIYLIIFKLNISFLLNFRFEEHHGFISGARKVYERAVEFFGEETLDERLFIAFAKFEEGQREVIVKFIVTVLQMCSDVLWLMFQEFK